MAGRPAAVLKVAVKSAKTETEQKAGEIHRYEKQRCQSQEGRPQPHDQREFNDQLVRPPPPPWLVGVMSQVPVAPEPLRQPEQQTQVGRKHQVQSPRPEKGNMNEVVRNGVRVPPESDRDKRDRRRPPQ